jgi:beta-glucuronidase
MKKTKTVLLILFLPAIVLSQRPLVNTSNRHYISLNGNWNYIVDPYETGYYNFHSEPYERSNAESPAAFYNNYHAKSKSELVEYDFDKSAVIKIPGDWNTQVENLFYYEGTVWLKKSFDYTFESNKRIFVYFGAVNYKAEVYFNVTKPGTQYKRPEPMDINGFQIT